MEGKIIPNLAKVAQTAHKAGFKKCKALVRKLFPDVNADLLIPPIQDFPTPYASKLAVVDMAPAPYAINYNDCSVSYRRFFPS